MKNGFLYFALIVFATAATGVRAQSTAVDAHRIVPIREMTQDVEVLYGDPEKPGEPFVIRIRELAGGMIPPHRHPVDEHITVVRGTLFFAVGDKFDRGVMKEMKTGSYAFIPKGSIMFGYTPDAAIVQVHGVGPFQIHWRAGEHWQDALKTLDSPDAAQVFRFKRGDRVMTSRGSGRIRQGYDSGEVVGYEIDGDGGSLFIAEECEIVEVNGKKADEPPRDSKCFSSGTASSQIRNEKQHKQH
ncbi:MAG TPA: cupin domain-containing protein [Pyrinomonadaceae bacterium]|nr:cupin domain-containing protein [Pyrinomonadaceae bacterium]